MPEYRKTRTTYDSNKIPRRDDRVKWAYLAGLIDGDGCIFVGFYPKRETRTTTINVSNTNINLLKYLEKTFGGTFTKEKPTGVKKTPGLWYITGNRSCKIFLVRLRPYLIAKREQAETALEFIKTLRLRVPRYKGDRKGKLYINIGKHHELWLEREEQRRILSLKNKELNQNGGAIYA